MRRTVPREGHNLLSAHLRREIAGQHAGEVILQRLAPSIGLREIEPVRRRARYHFGTIEIRRKLYRPESESESSGGALHCCGLRGWWIGGGRKKIKFRRIG